MGGRVFCEAYNSRFLKSFWHAEERPSWGIMAMAWCGLTNRQWEGIDEDNGDWQAA